MEYIKDSWRFWKRVIFPLDRSFWTYVAIADATIAIVVLALLFVLFWNITGVIALVGAFALVIVAIAIMHLLGVYAYWGQDIGPLSYEMAYAFGYFSWFIENALILGGIVIFVMKILGFR